MSQQLPLALQLNSPSRLQDFIFGQDTALQQLLAQQRQGQGEPFIYLHGAPSSGRTHLLMGQCHAAQAQGLSVAYLPCREIAQLAPEILEGLQQLDLIAIDDVQNLAKQATWETALFNLFNRAREHGTRLLISADCPAQQLPLRLPDLRSRLGWGLTYRLHTPNDQQRQQLIQQLAQRRGLEMTDEVARYLVQRHSRDTRALLKLIERLDHDSLAEQRRLSIPFVRQRLHNH